MAVDSLVGPVFIREQIPGLLQRHQRRTVRLVRQISHVARELGGRAAARLAGLLAVPVSRSTALRRLRRLPLPRLEIPRVIGVDDFALRRRQRYATIIIDAETAGNASTPCCRPRKPGPPHDSGAPPGAQR